MSNAEAHAYQERKYDSDDQSSMMSEPGSPQDIAMSDDDMLEDDRTAFSESPEDTFGPRLSTGSWQTRMERRDRVPTPIQPPARPGARPIQQAFALQNGIKQHVRSRHPQEVLSSSSVADHLEVPSPIDEDEVPTPPSAAEAAGSQLSMLTVNDMDMEPADTPGARLPSISIDEALPLSEHVQRSLEGESAIADSLDLMDSSNGEADRGLFVRKQRARSGALSSGHGSPSPIRAEPMRPDPNSLGAVKRGFSMGFRADCEKCQLRVPGHMNHFIS